MSWSLPSLILRIGYSSASLTFFLIISAVSMPIVKVERGAAAGSSPHILWTGTPRRLPTRSCSAVESAARAELLLVSSGLPAALGGLELEGIIGQRAGVGAEGGQDRLGGLAAIMDERRLARRGRQAGDRRHGPAHDPRRPHRPAGRGRPPAAARGDGGRARPGVRAVGGRRRGAVGHRGGRRGHPRRSQAPGTGRLARAVRVRRHGHARPRSTPPTGRSPPRVLDGLERTPLYARIDVVADGTGGLLLMELELVEPELFFRLAPDAASRLADAITTLTPDAGRPRRRRAVAVRADRCQVGCDHSQTPSSHQIWFIWWRPENARPTPSPPSGSALVSRPLTYGCSTTPHSAHVVQRL